MKKSKNISAKEVVEFFEGLLTTNKSYPTEELHKYLKAAGRVTGDKSGDWKDFRRQLVKEQIESDCLRVTTFPSLFRKYLEVRQAFAAEPKL